MRIIKTIYDQITINNKTYPVEIIYKTGKKNISYRFKDNKFVITTPYLARLTTIREGLIKFAPRLLAYKAKPLLLGKDYIYILGNKYEIKENNVVGETKLYSFKDEKDLKRKIKKWYLPTLKQLVEHYKNQMNIAEPLKISIKDMKTRYGSYSRKTKSLSFAFELIHYDIAMMEAVVVHELSHYYVFDHSKKFYDLVLKNYPNYYQVHAKLRKGIVK